MKSIADVPAKPRNGCHNRPAFLKALVVFDGYTSPTRKTVVTKTVPFNMEPECQYTLSKDGRTDAGCVGCKWRAEK